VTRPISTFRMRVARDRSAYVAKHDDEWETTRYTGSMDRPSVTLRDANPLYEEGVLFAQYLDGIAPFYRVMLGRRVVKIIGRAFTQPGHDLSYRNTVFAERAGAIVGMISGYATERHRRSVGPPLREALGGRALRMRIMARLMARQQWFLGTYADGDFYIQGFAVDENVRGQGIGSALLDAMEQRARASGSKRLILNVGAKNERARRLYDRRGMTVEAGWPKLPCTPPFVLRMAKPL
jgi:ribosomal protein S18 acetylase RimI-like enzyme